MKFRGSVTSWNIEFKWFFGVFKKYTGWKTGITNRCKDGRFVLFLDYDLVPMDWIVDELQYLQDVQGVGDFHIFKTGKGYHVVNTEKRSFSEVLRLMQLTSCDPNYIAVPLKYGKKAWTLRITKKKKSGISYEGSLRHKNKLVMSSPHNWLISELYGVASEGEEDGEKGFYKSKYPISE